MGEKHYIYYFTPEGLDRLKMYSEDAIAEKNITLAFEFERYVLEHPEMLARIPSGAEIVLLPKDDPELYRVNLEAARQRRKNAGQKIVYVEIDALAPPRSRLVNPQLAVV